MAATPVSAGPAPRLGQEIETGGAERGSSPAPAVLSSQALMQGAKAVDIAHNGAVYRLQATRQGKLILTK